MTIYEAIMKAADHIERHPDQFDFSTCSLPGCGSPGCALGWIAYFAGGQYQEGDSWRDGFLEGDDSDFYARMNECEPADACWTYDANDCAAALRIYAHKYHAPKTPDWEALAKPDAGFRQEVSA